MTGPDIRSKYLTELKDLLTAMGEKPFRAGQLFSWMHKKHVSSYDQMTDLSGTLREKLAKQYPLVTLAKAEELVSKDGTRKYLFALPDGNVIESVWMQYHHGNSVCISSQAGCAMGCAFCASTIGGKVRDLTASEMLEQIYRITELTGERVSNIVVMGTGEPFDNYDNLIRFIRLVTGERGLNISRRNITVSTCGLVPEMRRFAEDDTGATLAVSLHAPNDGKRRKLMPVARKYAIEDVAAAAKYYFEKTGRRVTFEYALIKGVNDSDEDAYELSLLLKGNPCHINLIPVNPVKERGFEAPKRSEIVNFQNKLEKYGINVTIRRGIAGDINGACGQLRKSFISFGTPRL